MSCPLALFLQDLYPFVLTAALLKAASRLPAFPETPSSQQYVSAAAESYQVLSRAE